MGYKNLTDVGRNSQVVLPVAWGYSTSRVGNIFVSTFQISGSSPLERGILRQEFKYRFTSEELKKLIPSDAVNSFAIVNIVRDAALRRDMLAAKINDSLKERVSKMQVKMNAGNFNAIVDVLRGCFGKQLCQMCKYDAFITMMNESKVKH